MFQKFDFSENNISSENFKYSKEEYILYLESMMPREVFTKNVTSLKLLMTDIGTMLHVICFVFLCTIK